MAEPFSGGHKCTSKNYGKFMWLELTTVTSQTLKYDVIYFCQYILQCFISLQRPLSTLHPIYLSTLHWLEHYTDLFTSKVVNRGLCQNEIRLQKSWGLSYLPVLLLQGILHVMFRKKVLTRLETFVLALMMAGNLALRMHWPNYINIGCKLTNEISVFYFF